LSLLLAPGLTLPLLPLRVLAQRSTATIGFLNTASRAPFAHLVAGFLKGLNEEGFVESRNLVIEYRWAEGDYGSLPTLARELVNRGVAVIAATGGEPSALAAKSVTDTIPIVFAIGGDPVKAGLVASLSHPGRNITGVSQFTFNLEAKRLGLLHEALPSATTVAMLVNELSPIASALVEDAEAAAAKLSLRLVVVRARSETDFDAAFATMKRERAQALIVSADPYFNARRAALIELAARVSMPAIYEFREFASAGGLMSYGSNLADTYRKVGLYVGRVLKGEMPADLPVLQPTVFEWIINLRTAKALGLELPATLLARADEVIE
jgi:putative ABC transport system substrate-binding protein